MSLSAAQRAELYNTSEFGRRYPGSRLSVCGETFSGTWFLGNNYRSKSGYYGAYPPRYVDRVMTMFPDIVDRRLHLFSGAVRRADGWRRFDLNAAGGAEDDLTIGDGNRVERYYRPGCFRLVLADPPYTPADAARYGTRMVDRRKVMAGVAEIIEPGGWLVWLDTVWPMARRDRLKLVGTVSIYRSSNHRVRSAFFFQKPAA